MVFGTVAASIHYKEDCDGRTAGENRAAQENCTPIQ